MNLKEYQEKQTKYIGKNCYLKNEENNYTPVVILNVTLSNVFLVVNTQIFGMFTPKTVGAGDLYQLIQNSNKEWIYIQGLRIQIKTLPIFPLSYL